MIRLSRRETNRFRRCNEYNFKVEVDHAFEDALLLANLFKIPKVLARDYLGDWFAVLSIGDQVIFKADEILEKAIGFLAGLSRG